MGRVLVQVLDDEGLGEGRFDMLARAALAVTTGADFEVAFGREDGGEG